MIRRFFTRDRTPKELDQATVVPGADAATILIVDDSPTEVHVLKKILEKQGFQVQVARDGQEGVDTAKRTHPDLILMDVVMPILNGFQATRQLQNDEGTAKIPVIMVTTKDQETDRSWGKRQGASEYLVKPVAPADLLAKIKVLLNG
ncbi:MAG: response regulator [gamma proteobacterium endosymbiont of Lamellibrachia anaximandri]|nr:response regulator [gamma proteobacterium endosymbiont of Lamellibrachia anaximandri]MBL3618015.1 response regulator [gamma proteobacterium endosymbiont of Lamellibrachia anaximandri]